jgi:dTMP kinase
MGKLLGPDAETLLFAAARDDHVRTVIQPALAQGTWVLCDRFADSTRVYQGRLGRVEPAVLNAMERVTIGDLKPDLTIILDVPAEATPRPTGSSPRMYGFIRSCAKPIARSLRPNLTAAC